MLSFLLAHPVCAQYEFNAWRFGSNAGLLFPATPASGPPQPDGSSFFAIEGCASIADSAGNLLLYTNAEQVYSRSGVQLSGGQLGSGGSNAVQGAILLKHPGPAHQYLLFKVDEAQNLFVGGLRYTSIEMASNGLAGRLVFPLPHLLTPAGYLVTEAMTAIRHANGADYWVIVHGYLNREFLSYHITEAGPEPVPVRSVVGSYHGFTNPGCPMRGSPDGHQLAIGLPGGA
ncbi:hypothetical protein [Hymenobacter sp. BRD67]|uniref:hypothetical protein n=1 Tax=Hymenobacter sp. BRD67 TaxID=2675877 RepID=UPI001566479B|nr:hypothetical protein [Hymenobacter sp. BRD67]QKG52773.1 hypothetical protein GKZ67_09385 [Hymenobacter sp. BRD67]